MKQVLTSVTTIQTTINVTLPTNRIIRQSSQPETTTSTVCAVHSTNSIPSSSLKQLKDHTDSGIANIAADSLRITGATRNFKQVIFFLMKNFEGIKVIFRCCKVLFDKC